MRQRDEEFTYKFNKWNEAARQGKCRFFIVTSGGEGGIWEAEYISRHRSIKTAQRAAERAVKRRDIDVVICDTHMKRGWESIGSVWPNGDVYGKRLESN